MLKKSFFVNKVTPTINITKTLYRILEISGERKLEVLKSVITNPDAVSLIKQAALHENSYVQEYCLRLILKGLNVTRKRGNFEILQELIDTFDLISDIIIPLLNYGEEVSV